MATLTRSKTVPSPTVAPLITSLTSNVPTPFPREQLEPALPPGLSYGHAEQPLVLPEQVQPSTHAIEEDVQQSSSSSRILNDVMPSIAFVQKSCIMTLNNLLSARTEWSPIVPDRRHSMPSSPQEASSTHQADLNSSSSALQTLVSNLRNRQQDTEMIEARQSDDDSDLIHELGVRVEMIAPSLTPSDTVLANALVSLLSHFSRLSVIRATSSQSSIQGLALHSSTASENAPPIDHFDALKRQLSDLQVERLSNQSETLVPGAPPAIAVEAALLWSKIDEELEKVVAMCKERAEVLPRFSMDHMPPKYDADDYDHKHDFEHPPDYEAGGREYLDDSKHRDPAPYTDEKMRLDLEAVTMAIDRLYLVAPQLHNQRVELKSTKVAQMEKARREGASVSSSRPSSRGKGKERELRDVRELENILDLLSKASERSMKDQTVVIEGGMQSRLEKARRRDEVKRERFVEGLVRHSAAGRLHGQDAVLQPRIKDPEAMLTLPEFIRESMPGAERIQDPQAMLSLPEFVKEPPPISIHEPECELPPFPPTKSKKTLRNRSLSAPPLSWLRPSLSRGATNVTSPKLKPADTNTAFDVVYVAEHHENLQHVLVFFTVTGATAGVEIEAEVLPPFPEHPDGGDHLVIKCGTKTSLPLMLPALALPGRKEVRSQGGHFEIKMSTVPHTDTSEEPRALLSSSELSSTSPTSFICASCSLPLVQSSKVSEYRDLPSEHWEELVESWMCHSDQQLHDQVMKHGKSGFWPLPGQALVGGSYILFDESSVTKTNLHVADEPKPGENWRIVRCICGAIVGRCQGGNTDGSALTYRLLKYAIRPVSVTAGPLTIPLSAFIVEDMTEFIQAHASYRFVIRDEEEELPRILIWLFKPNMRISYAAPSPRAIPKTASIRAAKVLFKLIKPSETPIDLKSTLDKYPGFPQAEYLSYPMSICRRLAGMLKGSNMVYPDSLRMMTGLEVGWLHRP